MDNFYEVRFEDGQWTVGRGGSIAFNIQADRRCYSTQQEAISAAKAEARRSTAWVMWRDRSGNIQGMADYGIPAGGRRLQSPIVENRRP
jgi:hypothetical protein